MGDEGVRDAGGARTKTRSSTREERLADFYALGILILFAVAARVGSLGDPGYSGRQSLALIVTILLLIRATRQAWRWSVGGSLGTEVLPLVVAGWNLVVAIDYRVYEGPTLVRHLLAIAVMCAVLFPLLLLALTEAFERESKSATTSASATWLATCLQAGLTLAAVLGPTPLSSAALIGSTGSFALSVIYALRDGSSPSTRRRLARSGWVSLAAVGVAYGALTMESREILLAALFYGTLTLVVHLLVRWWRSAP